MKDGRFPTPNGVEFAFAIETSFHLYSIWLVQDENTYVQEMVGAIIF
jgi:hypothetical protein